MRPLLALLALSTAAAAQVPLTPVDTVWVQPTAYASAIAFSPDGAYVASGGKRGGPPNVPGRIALWSAPDGALVDEFVGLTAGGALSSTNGLVFSAGSDRLASAHGSVGCAPNGGCYAQDPFLILWTVPDIEIDTLREFGSMIPTDLDLSPDGLQIAAGYTYDNSGAIRFHNPTTLASEVLLPGHRYATYDVQFSPDGRLLASVGDEPVARLWDAATGALVRTFNHSTSSSDLEEPISVAFSPDGTRLVTGLGDSGGGGTVTVWRVADGARLLQIDVRNVPGLSVSNTLVRVSPNGAYIIAAVSEEFSPTPGTYRTTDRLRLYDIETGALVADYDAGSVETVRVGGFSDLALSPGQTYQIAYALRGSLTVVNTAPLRLADGAVAGEAPAPSSTAALRRTGPNPFRTRTTLALDVAAAGPVRAEAFDVLGRRVAVLYDGPAAPGQPVSVPVDAAAWPAGVYTVRVAGAGAPLTQTLTVVR